MKLQNLDGTAVEIQLENIRECCKSARIDTSDTKEKLRLYKSIGHCLVDLGIDLEKLEE